MSPAGLVRWTDQLGQGCTEGGAVVVPARVGENVPAPWVADRARTEKSDALIAGPESRVIIPGASGRSWGCGGICAGATPVGACPSPRADVGTWPNVQGHRPGQRRPDDTRSAGMNPAGRVRWTDQLDEAAVRRASRWARVAR